MNDALTRRGLELRALCAQSYAIHPDWTAADHLNWLDFDYMGDEDYGPGTLVKVGDGLPQGTATMTVREVVENWFRLPSLAALVFGPGGRFAAKVA